MGWYLRKSVKFGPLRVNLSKSGIGYSFGVKGARIGTGPRGPYIAGGRYGIYYRQSLKTHTPVAPPAPHPLGVTPSVSYCTQCGAALLPGNDFCIQCGSHVAANAHSGTEEEKHDHHVSWALLGALAIVVLCVPFLTSLDSTRPDVAPSRPIPSIPKPTVSFRVEQKASGKPVTVLVPSDSTSQQITALVQYFRVEIQGQKFADLGIISPTSAHEGGRASDYTNGAVLFYREGGTKQGQVKRPAFRVAEYKWGIDGSFQKDSGRIWDGEHPTKLF